MPLERRNWYGAGEVLGELSEPRSLVLRRLSHAKLLQSLLPARRKTTRVDYEKGRRALNLLCAYTYDANEHSLHCLCTHLAKNESESGKARLTPLVMQTWLTGWLVGFCFNNLDSQHQLDIYDHKPASQDAPLSPSLSFVVFICLKYKRRGEEERLQHFFFTSHHPSRPTPSKTTTTVMVAVVAVVVHTLQNKMLLTAVQLNAEYLFETLQSTRRSLQAKASAASASAAVAVNLLFHYFLYNQHITRL